VCVFEESGLMVLITFTRALVFPLQLHSFSAKCQPRSGREERKKVALNKTDVSLLQQVSVCVCVCVCVCVEKL